MRYQIVVEGRTFEIEVTPEGQVWVNQQLLSVDLEGIDGLPLYSLLVNHRSYEAHVEAEEDGGCRVAVAGRPYRARLQAERRPRARKTERRPESGPAEVFAPLPGLLVEVRVAEGQRVGKGEVVAVLESMKMHLELRAPRSGVVQALHSAANREVAQGEVLAVIGQ